MMEERPLGIVIALVGAVGTAIAALANPLGIGETEVFGWLQITGVILGAAVTLLGLALAMEWVPYPARRRAGAASATPQTTVIKDSTPDRTA
jgi:hypothetical protein